MADRRAWGPMANHSTAWDDWPFGEFGKTVRVNHEPQWRAEADNEIDEEQAAYLANMILAEWPDVPEPADLLKCGNFADRQAALAMLRERLADDPARLAWLREVEWFAENSEEDET